MTKKEIALYILMYASYIQPLSTLIFSKMLMHYLTLNELPIFDHKNMHLLKILLSYEININIFLIANEYMGY